MPAVRTLHDQAITGCLAWCGDPECHRKGGCLRLRTPMRQPKQAAGRIEPRGPRNETALTMFCAWLVCLLILLALLFAMLGGKK